MPTRAELMRGLAQQHKEERAELAAEQAASLDQREARSHKQSLAVQAAMQQYVEGRRKIKTIKRQLGSGVPASNQRLGTATPAVNPGSVRTQPAISVPNNSLRIATPAVNPGGLLTQPRRLNPLAPSYNPDWTHPIPSRAAGTHPRDEYMFDFGKYTGHYFTEVPERQLKSIGMNPNVVGSSLHPGLYDAFVHHRPDLLFTTLALRNPTAPGPASQYTMVNDTTVKDTPVNNTMAEGMPFGGLAVADLLEAGVTVTDLLEAGMTLIDLIEAGVGLEDILEAELPFKDRLNIDYDLPQVPSSSSSASPSSSGPAFSTPPHGHVSTMPSSSSSAPDSSPLLAKMLMDDVAAYWNRHPMSNNTPRIAPIKIKIEEDDSAPANNTRAKGKGKPPAPTVVAGPSTPVNPKKRGRGRPRKNPLPEVDEPSTKRQQTMYEYLGNTQDTQQIPAPQHVVYQGMIIWDGERYIPYLDLTSPEKKDKGKGIAPQQ